MTETAEIQVEIMKHTNLRIYLGHGDDAERDVIVATLNLLSHSVELSTDSSAVFKRRCMEAPPDLAVVGTDLAGEDTFSVADEVADLGTCPVVVYIRREDIDRSHRLLRNEVTGVLVQPATELDWRPALYLACRRWEQSARLGEEAERLKREIDAIDAGHFSNGEIDAEGH